jgi:hypothetical protein
MTILDLKECFREGSRWTDFLSWLAQSNHPKIRSSYAFEPSELNKVVEESLSEILDILLREPLADYFWYRYPEYGGELLYSLPHHDTVPADALRVDKEKIKSFLRNWKLEKLGI